MARSTIKGNRFIADLLDFMIANQVTSQVISKRDQPINLAGYPIERARYDKILQVLRSYSEFEAGAEPRNSFTFFDHFGEDDYRVSFDLDPRTEAITVSLQRC